MLQDVLSLKPPNEIIDEAARFFTQRRIKVIARSKNSLRFALSAAHAAEAGQVKAVREATGQTRVSVETGGPERLAHRRVVSPAISVSRARSGARARRRRRAAGTTRLTGVSLDALGSALGMEPPRPQRPPAQQPAARRPTPAPAPAAPPEPDPAVALDDLVAPPPVAAAGESDE